MASSPSSILQLFAKASLSREEKERLLEYLEQDNNAELEQWLLQQYKSDIKENNEIDQHITKEMWQYIKAHTGTQVPRLSGWHLKWVAAAVLVLALGAGAYFYATLPKTERPVATINEHLPADIAPGGNRAVLTLADGKQIMLESAANGNLAQQGNTKIIKLDNGQVAYNAGATPEGELLYNTISTPKGGQYQIVLPDGSKVWLNAASSIRFPTAFSGPRRNVEIAGEAYLEIAKNSSQPFMVKARGTEVKVLGTSFNINAYENEDAVTTTLVEGSVKINAAVILKAGQQAITEESSYSVKINNKPDVEGILAWKNGFFDFNGSDLKSVMRQLERWYGIKVQYEGSLPTIKFRGKMSRGVAISDVLKFLSDSDLTLKLEGKTLIVL